MLVRLSRPVLAFCGLCGLLQCGVVGAHGSVTFPPPRQAVDGTLFPWNDTAVPMGKFLYWCPVPGKPAPGALFNLSGSGGQSCFWFSDGCSIGCERCTGNSQLLVKNADFVATGALTGWGGANISFANTTANRAKLFGRAACEHPAKATICDKRLRTLNVEAECGAADDVFYYNPWRYPGSAPVIDSCGSAGGRLPGQGIGNAGRGMINTSLTKLADAGSRTLKPFHTGTVWTAGSAVEVGWMQEAWHGGGYSYRLCPAEKQLTEECFAKMPLAFVGNSSLRYGGEGGRRVWFDSQALGWETNVGTLPPGSSWRKVPLPRAPTRAGEDWGWKNFGASFEPVCEEPKACTEGQGPRVPLGACQCSGQGAPTNPIGAEVVDRVLIPADIPAGDYVLGWRWDCEQTPQVWNSCSDVTIKARAKQST